MTPVGGEGGSYESEFGIDLGIWNRQSQLGKTFSSSTLFGWGLWTSSKPLRDV
jgi:Uma2 family endonuclease